jgi:hypothetical protein
MSRRSRTVLCCVALLVIAAAASAFLVTRAAPEKSVTLQTTAQLRAGKRGPRNMFLQPEALRVARQLGKRFSATSKETSVVAGILTISGAEQPLTMTRRQTDTGEQLELLIGSRALTWNAQDGTKAVDSPVGATERLLAERLTLDSPDNFVLAQLRGASYFTIARNVRPAGANDGYAGPLWDLVRVAEPPEKDEARSFSPWRIYYLNVQSNLPDRVEYELNGQPITVEFLEWTKQGEETSPSHVRWSTGGQTLMEFRVTSISLNQQ